MRWKLIATSVGLSNSPVRQSAHTIFRYEVSFAIDNLDTVVSRISDVKHSPDGQGRARLASRIAPPLDRTALLCGDGSHQVWKVRADLGWKKQFGVALLSRSDLLWSPHPPVVWGQRNSSREEGTPEEAGKSICSFVRLFRACMRNRRKLLEGSLDV